MFICLANPPQKQKTQISKQSTLNRSSKKKTENRYKSLLKFLKFKEQFLFLILTASDHMTIDEKENFSMAVSHLLPWCM